MNKVPKPPEVRKNLDGCKSVHRSALSNYVSPRQSPKHCRRSWAPYWLVVIRHRSVYRGSKEGSIDGWILVMRRYLQRTQAKATLDDKAWRIIVHLEGGTCNYIINKAGLNGTHLRMCLSCWRVGLVREVTACKCGKPSRLVTSWKKKIG